jgi:hypothetical protein
MKLSRVLMLVIAVGSFTLAVWAQDKPSQDDQIKAYIEMMRKDLRTERNSIVDQAMGLEPAGKAKFWGIYDKYSAEVKGIWDQRLANITKYADNVDNMTDAVADELAVKALDIQSQRLAIQKKYYAQMKAALGARVGGRFLQVESMLNDLLDLQLGSEIPLIK